MLRFLIERERERESIPSKMKIGSINYHYRILIVFLAILPALSFLPERSLPSILKTRESIGISSSSMAAEKTRKDADMLPLSSFDRRKFHHMKTRGRVMPIIVMGEPILPGQRLYFRSGDPKFENLIKYIAQIEKDYAETVMNARGAPNIEIGILGFDQQSGGVSHNGVTARVETKNFVYSLTAENGDRAITTSFKGARIFQLAADPWMDPSGSFHMAHVEILDGEFDDEPRGKRRRVSQIESDELFAQIPSLAEKWMGLMFEAGLATPASLALAQKEIVDTTKLEPQQQLLHIEDDPHHRIRRRNNNYALYPPRRQTERAIWVAALLNPVRKYPVAVSAEMRPAFLACRNDRDRFDLCITTLRMSIEFLEIYIDAKKREGNGGNETA